MKYGINGFTELMVYGINCFRKQELDIIEESASVPEESKFGVWLSQFAFLRNQGTFFNSFLYGLGGRKFSI